MYSSPALCQSLWQAPHYLTFLEACKVGIYPTGQTKQLRLREMM